MSRNPFVVGDRLIIDQRALCEVGSRDDDAAGALTVRRAGDVVGCCGGLEGGYGFNRDWRLRKKSEELWKFRLHLGDIVAEVFEGLLRGSRKGFRVRFEGGPGSREVGEPLFLGHSDHL